MKHVIVIPDGCADEALGELQGRTPLQAARTPAMDRIAKQGVVGLSLNTPHHLPAGSDVANMSLLGYDPVAHFTGRAPLEAAALGIELKPQDWAIRCNLVTIVDQTMIDFTAGHISSEEATALLETANQRLPSGPWQFVPGVSYRNLLLYRPADDHPPFSIDTTATPPHDLTDKCVVDDFPRGPGSELLNDLMQQSIAWFADHPLNRRRIAQGKLPATNVWLWGLGSRPLLEPFQARFGKRGVMITAVDLLRGLAALIGWEVREAPGATGYLDTDYASKGRAAIAALAGADVVCVHIEAPDEASHEGDAPAKVRAIESIDRWIVAPLLDHLEQLGPYRVLISPDHPTPIRTKTHSHAMVPFAICGRGVAPDAATTYDESSAGSSGLKFDPGWRLMEWFLSEGT